MKSLIFLFLVVIAFLVCINGSNAELTTFPFQDVVTTQVRGRVEQAADGIFYVDNYPGDCLQDAGCLPYAQKPAA